MIIRFIFVKWIDSKWDIRQRFRLPRCSIQRKSGSLFYREVGNHMRILLNPGERLKSTFFSIFRVRGCHNYCFNIFLYLISVQVYSSLISFDWLIDENGGVKIFWNIFDGTYTMYLIYSCTCNALNNFKCTEFTLKCSSKM